MPVKYFNLISEYCQRNHLTFNNPQQNFFSINDAYPTFFVAKNDLVQLSQCVMIDNKLLSKVEENTIKALCQELTISFAPCKFFIKRNFVVARIDALVNTTTFNVATLEEFYSYTARALEYGINPTVRSLYLLNKENKENEEEEEEISLNNKSNRPLVVNSHSL